MTKEPVGQASRPSFQLNRISNGAVVLQSKATPLCERTTVAYRCAIDHGTIAMFPSDPNRAREEAASH